MSDDTTKPAARPLVELETTLPVGKPLGALESAANDEPPPAAAPQLTKPPPEPAVAVPPPPRPSANPPRASSPRAMTADAEPTATAGTPLRPELLAEPTALGAPVTPGPVPQAADAASRASVATLPAAPRAEAEPGTSELGARTSVATTPAGPVATAVSFVDATARATLTPHPDAIGQRSTAAAALFPGTQPSAPAVVSATQQTPLATLVPSHVGTPPPSVAAALVGLGIPPPPVASSPGMPVLLQGPAVTTSIGPMNPPALEPTPLLARPLTEALRDPAAALVPPGAEPTVARGSPLTAAAEETKMLGQPLSRLDDPTRALGRPLTTSAARRQWLPVALGAAALFITGAASVFAGAAKEGANTATTVEPLEQVRQRPPPEPQKEKLEPSSLSQPDAPVVAVDPGPDLAPLPMGDYRWRCSSVTAVSNPEVSMRGGWITQVAFKDGPPMLVVASKAAPLQRLQATLQRCRSGERYVIARRTKDVGIDASSKMVFTGGVQASVENVGLEKP